MQDEDVQPPFEADSTLEPAGELKSTPHSTPSQPETKTVNNSSTTISAVLENTDTPASTSNLAPVSTTATPDSVAAFKSLPAYLPPRTPSSKRKYSARGDPEADYNPGTSSLKRRPLSRKVSSTSTKSSRRSKDWDEASYSLQDESENFGKAEFCLNTCKKMDENEMICCDGNSCKVGGQWFHTSCVGFRAMPPQVLRKGVKWFCLDCRVIEGKGVRTSGIYEPEDEDEAEAEQEDISGEVDDE